MRSIMLNRAIFLLLLIISVVLFFMYDKEAVLSLGVFWTQLYQQYLSSMSGIFDLIESTFLNIVVYIALAAVFIKYILPLFDKMASENESVYKKISQMQKYLRTHTMTIDLKKCILSKTYRDEVWASLQEWGQTIAEINTKLEKYKPSGEDK